MNHLLRVYVNGKALSVPPGSMAIDAIREFSAREADDVESGISRLLDSRGLPIDAFSRTHGGAIYRIVPVRSRGDNGAP